METVETIAHLLQPYVGAAMQEGTPSQPAPVDWAAVHGKLAVYLDLILKWNARTNLTAIRQPEEIVRRHFGESLFLGTHLGHCATLLDFGSGAGLPGIPVQLMRPDVHVTLAESQGKKAAFLREVVRELALTSEVWAARVEQMEPERKFDAVAMRAVDRMADAVREGSAHARQKMLVLGSSEVADYLGLRDGFATVNAIPLPELRDGVLVIALR